MGSYVGRPGMRPSNKPKFNTDKKKQPNPDWYGDNWTELRDYVLRRDNYSCQIGKISSNRCALHFPPPFHNLLHAHHVVPLPKGANHPSNLITLCQECHGRIHDKFLGKISDKQKKIGRSK